MTIKHSCLLYEDFPDDCCVNCCFMIKEESVCDAPLDFPHCTVGRSWRQVRELNDDEL